jgi:hypothetical protein
VGVNNALPLGDQWVENRRKKSSVESQISLGNRNLLWFNLRRHTTCCGFGFSAGFDDLA